MYHLFLSNDQHKFNQTTSVMLNYLQYQNNTTGVLINLKKHVDLMKRPLQQTLVQVGDLDAYRFHPNDYALIQNTSGGIDWESDKLEPFHLGCDLRVTIKYPSTDNLKVTGEPLIGNIPLQGYGVSACRTNYIQPNTF